MKFVFLLIVGILFICFSFFLKKDTTPPVSEMLHTTGMIDNIIYGETGNVMYYVTFEENGVQKRGQSIHYKSHKQKYHEKDYANILVYYSKNNKPRIIIDDPDLPACSDSTSKYSLGFLIIGILLSLVAIISIFKSII